MVGIFENETFYKKIETIGAPMNKGIELLYNGIKEIVHYIIPAELQKAKDLQEKRKFSKLEKKIGGLKIVSGKNYKTDAEFSSLFLQESFKGIYKEIKQYFESIKGQKW